MGTAPDPEIEILAPAEAHFARGQTLALLERWPEALAAYESALAAQPDYPEAWHRHAAALYELGEFEDALASNESALRLRPGYADALSNLGATLRMLNRVEEALGATDRALAHDPQHWSAHATRGNALRSLGRIDEALVTFDRALEAAPGNVSARLNRALCLLVAGDFERGWPEYEWRWKTAEHQRHPHGFDQPIWLGGEEVAGRTILLHAEQGLGDTLQFCRYATLLAEAGATVMLRAPLPCTVCSPRWPACR